MPISLSGSLELTGSIITTGTITMSGSIASASFATTSSNALTASSADTFVVRNNFTGSNALLTGTLTAQTLVVQTVTSSILYTSGSNRFGSQLTDRQTFTGSFYQTGSIAVFSNNLGIGVSQPSSPLSIGGTFNGNTPLICITGTGTGVYQRVIAAINPGMNPGDDLTIQMGTALNSKNVGQLNYHHEGAGCATNRMSIGLYGVDDVLNVTGNGFVGIGTCTPTVKLDILGNNEVMNIAGCNSISAYTGYYYNTSTLVGYIGNGSSILSGAASSDFIFRSQGALVYATCGNNERMRITGAGDLQFKNTSTSAQFIYGGSNSGYLLIGGGEGSSLNCGANIVLVGNDRNGTNTRGEISLQAGGTSSGGFINLLTCGTERMRVTSAGPTIFSNNVCINGAGYGLQFTGGNNRIYFGACRAIEGSTSGTTLQIGENYDKTQIQSSAMMYNGSGGNSPKLYFGGEGNETAGAKAIYLETYWMIIQPHVNEGLRFRAVNASGTQYTIAKMYGTGTFSLDQYSNGTLSVSGGVVVSSSDKCMKIDDGGINIALPKIMCLNPRYFYWKSETCLNSCDRQLGFYAQDVSEVLGTEVANQSHNCSWGIYDRGIIAMLTKAMQEQQCTICSQATMINTLKTCIGIA